MFIYTNYFLLLYIFDLYSYIRIESYWAHSHFFQRSLRIVIEN